MLRLHSTQLQMQPQKIFCLSFYIEPMLFSPLIWILELRIHTSKLLTLQPKFQNLYVQPKNRLPSHGLHKNSNMGNGTDICSWILVIKSCYRSGISHFCKSSERVRTRWLGLSHNNAHRGTNAYLLDNVSACRQISIYY